MNSRHQIVDSTPDDGLELAHARLAEERIHGSPAHAVRGVVDCAKRRLGRLELFCVPLILVAFLAGTREEFFIVLGRDDV